MQALFYHWRIGKEPQLFYRGLERYCPCIAGILPGYSRAGLLTSCSIASALRAMRVLTLPDCPSVAPAAWAAVGRGNIVHTGIQGQIDKEISRLWLSKKPGGPL